MYACMPSSLKIREMKCHETDVYKTKKYLWITDIDFFIDFLYSNFYCFRFSQKIKSILRFVCKVNLSLDFYFYTCTKKISSLDFLYSESCRMA